METIEGRQICFECLNGKHEHPVYDEEMRNPERTDCKNTDKLNGQTYQCQCGTDGMFKDGKWQCWPEIY